MKECSNCNALRDRAKKYETEIWEEKKKRVKAEERVSFLEVARCAERTTQTRMELFAGTASFEEPVCPKCGSKSLSPVLRTIYKSCAAKKLLDSVSDPAYYEEHLRILREDEDYSCYRWAEMNSTDVIGQVLDWNCRCGYVITTWTKDE